VIHRGDRAHIEHTLAHTEVWKIWRDYRRAAHTLTDTASGIVHLYNERFSSWVRAGFGGVEYEEGLHDRGGAAGAAAEFGQDLPALEGGDGAFAEPAQWCVGAVNGLLVAGQSRPAAVAFERSHDAAAGALISLVGKGQHVASGQRLDQFVGAGRDQVVGGAGQSW